MKEYRWPEVGGHDERAVAVDVSIVRYLSCGRSYHSGNGVAVCLVSVDRILEF